MTSTTISPGTQASVADSVCKELISFVNTNGHTLNFLSDAPYSMQIAAVRAFARRPCEVNLVFEELQRDLLTLDTLVSQEITNEARKIAIWSADAELGRQLESLDLQIDAALQYNNHFKNDKPNSADEYSRRATALSGLILRLTTRASHIRAMSIDAEGLLVRLNISMHENLTESRARFPHIYSLFGPAEDNQKISVLLGALRAHLAEQADNDRKIELALSEFESDLRHLAIKIQADQAEKSWKLATDQSTDAKSLRKKNDDFYANIDNPSVATEINEKLLRFFAAKVYENYQSLRVLFSAIYSTSLPEPFSSTTSESTPTSASMRRWLAHLRASVEFGLQYHESCEQKAGHVAISIPLPGRDSDWPVLIELKTVPNWAALSANSSGVLLRQAIVRGNAGPIFKISTVGGARTVCLVTASQPGVAPADCPRTAPLEYASAGALQLEKYGEPIAGREYSLELHLAVLDSDRHHMLSTDRSAWTTS